MYIKTWYKVDCPKCNKSNWVNNGDVNDQTVPDVEGVECWYSKCKYKFTLDGDTDAFEEAYEPYYTKGLRKPS